MSYPAHLFSEVEKQPNLFLCEKDGKQLFLFGTYHVLPFSVIPNAYVNMMKKAKTLLLERCEAPPTEADLIAGGFVSAEPQGKGFDEKLTIEARQILEIAVKRYCLDNKLATIPLNRIKLDRALWLCRFATNVGGMEDTLESLFPGNAFGLEKRDTTKPMPQNSIDDLNEALPASFGCLKEAPEYPPEVLSGMEEYLVGESLFNPHYCYYQEIEPEVVVSRNNKWMPEISSHLQKNTPVLVAVGHTHLVGRTGLLCLLQNAGFKIFQYSADKNSFDQPFMPDLLYNSLAVQYAVGSQLQTILGRILETTTANTKTISAESTATATTMATTMPIEHERALETSISLVLQYLQPPLLFSYPTTNEPILKIDSVDDMNTISETAATTADTRAMAATTSCLHK